MLSFEEFQEYIKKNLPDMLSTSCPNATVSLTSVTKNNGRELHAVCVRPEGSDIAPTIYLESFYQKYEEGFTLDAVLSDIAEVSMSHMDTPSEFSTIGKDFQNFDFVKDKIIMVAVNAERNMTLLDSAPHQRREDLALIYKVMVGNDREGIATITIKNEHLSFWDKTVEDLHALAMENTKELLPAKILSMDNIMLEMFGGELPEDLAGMEQERDRKSVV